MTGQLVSRHFFRRTARRRAARLTDTYRQRNLAVAFRVVPATRGPYRWEVRRRDEA